MASNALITISPFSPIDAVATPKNSENITICRISLFDIDSKKLFGNTWLMKSFKESAVFCISVLNGYRQHQVHFRDRAGTG